MNTIFHEHLHKTIECYVDDIAIKNRAKGDHVQIWREYSTSCGYINWRWTQPSPSLGYLVTSSLDLLLHPIVSTSTLRKFVLFRRCILQELSKNLEDCQNVWPTFKDSFQIFQDVANPLPSWWRTESHLFGIMLAKKCSRKSSDTSHIHLSGSSSIRKTLPDKC